MGVFGSPSPICSKMRTVQIPRTQGGGGVATDVFGGLTTCVVEGGGFGVVVDDGGSGCLVEVGG